MSSPFKFDQSVEPSNLKNISTEILKPISIDDNQAIFVLRNTGYLDRKTRLTLSAVASVAGVSYPMSCGVASLIRSARLTVSGKVIAQNNSVGDVIAMKSNFEDVEGRKNVLRARLGIHNTWEHSRRGANNSLVQDQAGTAIASGDAVLVGDEYNGYTNDKQGKIVPANINWDNSVGEYEDSVQNAFNGSNYGLTNDVETTGKFYISLEQLFPWLYTAVGRDVLELPLMYIKEEIQLVIQFSRNGSSPITNHRGLNDARNLGRGFKVNIIQDECNLLIDYLHYFDNSATAKEIMGDGLTLNYADLEMINLSMNGLPATPSIRNKSKNNYNLGLTGKRIRQMYVISKPQVQVEENVGTIPVGGALLPQIANNPTNIVNGDYVVNALPEYDTGDPLLVRVVVGGNTITSITCLRSPVKVVVGEQFRIAKSNFVASDAPTAINQDMIITLVAGNIQGGANGVGKNYQKQSRLNGRYCSNSLSNFNDGTQYQINVNGKNLYSNPVQSVQEQLLRLSSAWGSKWQTPMSQFCLWDSVADDLDNNDAKFRNNQPRAVGSRFDLKSIISSEARINGNLLTDLHGCSNYIGIDLQKFVMSDAGNIMRMDLPSSGTEVVNAPIFLNIERDIPQNQNNDNREILIVCLVEKMIQMKNGSVSVF